MIKKEMVDYIASNLKRGYSIEALQKYLIKLGYPMQDVEDSSKAAYALLHPQLKPLPKQEVKTKIHFHFTSHQLIAISVVMFVCAGLILYFLLSSYVGGGFQLNLYSSSSKSVYPGEELEFTIDVRGADISKIDFTYMITDSLTQKEVLTTNNALGAEEYQSIIIPKDLSQGTYEIKVKGSKALSSSESSFIFIVNEKEEEIEQADYIEIKEEETEEESECKLCEDENPCTSDECDQSTGFECIHIYLSNCCGNNICEFGEDKTACSIDC